MELGTSLYAKLVAGIFVIGIGLFLGFLLLDRAVDRFGIIGGTVLVVGILLLIAYFYDRKHAKSFEDDDARSVRSESPRPSFPSR